MDSLKSCQLFCEIRTACSFNVERYRRFFIPVLALIVFLCPVMVSAQTYVNKAGDTMTGTLNDKVSINSPVINGFFNAGACGDATYAPSWCAGSDLGAWVNAAFSSCGDYCTVILPSTASAAAWTTTINIPVHSYGHSALVCDKGGIFTYTGSAAAIRIDAPDGGVPYADPKIMDCNIVGTSSGTDGIRIGWTNMSTWNVRVSGFSNGNGVSLHGTDVSNHYELITANNKNNVYVTVDDYGHGFGSNANHWIGGHQSGALQHPFYVDGGNGNTISKYTFDGPNATASEGCLYIKNTNKFSVEYSYCEPAVASTYAAIIDAGTVATFFIGVHFATFSTGATIYDNAVYTTIVTPQEGGSPPYFYKQGPSSAYATLFTPQGYYGNLIDTSGGSGNPIGVYSPLETDLPAAVKVGQNPVATSVASPTVNRAACVKSVGPPIQFGYCSTAVAANGSCTCN